jgi:hypothetical protein
MIIIEKYPRSPSCSYAALIVFRGGADWPRKSTSIMKQQPKVPRPTVISGAGKPFLGHGTL